MDNIKHSIFKFFASKHVIKAMLFSCVFTAIVCLVDLDDHRGNIFGLLGRIIVGPLPLIQAFILKNINFTIEDSVIAWILFSETFLLYLFYYYLIFVCEGGFNKSKIFVIIVLLGVHILVSPFAIIFQGFANW